MPTFLVTFHKLVPDGRGHGQRVLQQRVVVPASYEEAAAEAARMQFCRNACITD